MTLLQNGFESSEIDCPLRIANTQSTFRILHINGMMAFEIVKRPSQVTIRTQLFIPSSSFISRLEILVYHLKPCNDHPEYLFSFSNQSVRSVAKAFSQYSQTLPTPFISSSHRTILRDVLPYHLLNLPESFRDPKISTYDQKTTVIKVAVVQRITLTVRVEERRQGMWTNRYLATQLQVFPVELLEM